MRAIGLSGFGEGVRGAERGGVCPLAQGRASLLIAHSAVTCGGRVVKKVGLCRCVRWFGVVQCTRERVLHAGGGDCLHTREGVLGCISD